MCACATLLACLAEARTVYVSAADGDDGNGGLERDDAVATLTRASEIVTAGDTLVVGPGTYYEQPTFSDLGTSADSPFRIRADPRGRATVSAMWPDAARGETDWRDDGGGVFSAEADPSTFGVFDSVYLFRFNSVADLRVGRAQSVDLDLPPYGFAWEEGRTYVRLPGGVNPNGRHVLLSAGHWSEPGATAVMTINDSPHVTIDGLRFEGSGYHCLRFDYDSVAATIRNTLFHYCRVGARLPDRTVVEWSEYGYPGFHDFAEEVRQRNEEEGIEAMFTLVKDYHDPVRLEGGIGDSAATYLSGLPASRDLEFHHNFMFEAFDGERLGNFEYSESHHNVYLYNYDNHIEFESWAGYGARELRFHDSLLLAGSMGPISHQEPSIIGPQYVYRNVVSGYDAHGWESWTQIKSSMPNATGGVFYFHNLFIGTRGGLVWEPDHLVLRNNIFIFTSSWDDEDFELDSDYNLLVNEVDKPVLRGPNGIYSGADSSALRFREPAALDYGLTAGSPALDIGLDLPGFNDGAPGGPDLGPFELGAGPGPDWPRPRRTVFVDDDAGGDADVDAGGGDVGVDAGGGDAGGGDAGSGDVAVDAGGSDAGSGDVAVDAGGSDAGSGDVAVDAGGGEPGGADVDADAGGGDSSVASGGCACTAAGSRRPAAAALIALVAAVRRRGPRRPTAPA